MGGVEKRDTLCKSESGASDSVAECVGGLATVSLDVRVVRRCRRACPRIPEYSRRRSPTHRRRAMPDPKVVSQAVRSRLRPRRSCRGPVARVAEAEWRAEELGGLFPRIPPRVHHG